MTPGEKPCLTPQEVATYNPRTTDLGKGRNRKARRKDALKMSFFCEEGKISRWEGELRRTREGQILPLMVAAQFVWSKGTWEIAAEGVFPLPQFLGLPLLLPACVISRRIPLMAN